MQRTPTPTAKTWFVALWTAFIVQIAGRLLDLNWHRTHPDFETGADQVAAHWLVWLGTLLVIAAATLALRDPNIGRQRPGLLTVAAANGLYALVAVVHFIQHLNHSEVAWTHLSLVVTNVVALVGVLMVTAAYAGASRRSTVTAQ